MQRFADQPLGPTPHLAVVSSDKVGNFVVSTPLLRGLRTKYPEATIDLYGSETNKAFEAGCPWVDFRWSLYGNSDRRDFERVREERSVAAGPYDLVINLDGFNSVARRAAGGLGGRYVVGDAVDPETERPVEVGSLPEHRLLQEPDWDHPGIVDRYPGVLESNYIAEIFCRLAFVESSYFELHVATEPAPFEVPAVLLHVTTTRTAKMWPLSRWERVVDWCAGRGFAMGLIGSAPARQRALYNAGDTEDQLLDGTGVTDLRGRTSLTQLAGALQQARALVTVDAGPLHVAAAVGCPTVAVFGNDTWGVGASPMRLWAPRVPHVRIPRSTRTCEVCVNNRYKNTACLVAGHPCMAGLPASAVARELETLLRVAPRRVEA